MNDGAPAKGRSSFSGGFGQFRGRVEAREERRPRRAKVGDDLALLLCAGEERLPPVQVLGTMEVAGGDRREPALGRPSVEVVPVEELPAVDETAEPAPVPRPAEGEARRDGPPTRAI